MLHEGSETVNKTCWILVLFFFFIQDCKTSPSVNKVKCLTENMQAYFDSNNKGENFIVLSKTCWTVSFPRAVYVPRGHHFFNFGHIYLAFQQ